MVELDLTSWILITCAALAAGWVDAVVGGGGLIQLPALMLTGMSPLHALATNKVGSLMGTSVSALTYARRIQPDLKTALPMAAAALAGGIAGAHIATMLPGHIIKPVVILALAGVLLWVLLRPESGLLTQPRRKRHQLLAALIGGTIGLYDGMVGPGTGSFLIISLVSLLGYAFLPASAVAKIVNFATNLGALILFVPAGAVLWHVGIALGLANMAGSYLGARIAIARGSRFIRGVLLVVVTGLLLRLLIG